MTKSNVKTNLSINTTVDILVYCFPKLQHNNDVITGQSMASFISRNRPYVMFKKSVVFQPDGGILITETRLRGDMPEANDEEVFLQQARVATSLIDNHVAFLLDEDNFITILRDGEEIDMESLDKLGEFCG